MGNVEFLPLHPIRDTEHHFGHLVQEVSVNVSMIKVPFPVIITSGLSLVPCSLTKALTTSEDSCWLSDGIVGSRWWFSNSAQLHFTAGIFSKEDLSFPDSRSCVFKGTLGFMNSFPPSNVYNSISSFLRSKVCCNVPVEPFTLPLHPSGS